MRSGFAGVMLGVGIVALVVPFRQVRAQGADDAETLIRHGIELRKAHDDEGAVRAFQRAYDQVHTPRAAAQLGLAEQALGRWEDAARHVGEALHATGDAWVAKNRATLDDTMGVIQAHLGRVEVLGDPEGAEVWVNGRSIGKLPLAEPVRVSAGQVDVELRAPGYVSAQRTLAIVGGQYQRLVLHLAREAAAESPAGSKLVTAGAATNPGPASPGSQAPVEAPRSQARLVLQWSAAGAAGAGLAVGIVAAILHSQNVSKFDAFAPACFDDNGKAVHSDESAASTCQPALNAYRSDMTWEIVGFVGAGVFAATWLVLQLAEGPPHPGEVDHAMARPLCVPSLSGGGLVCAVRF